MYYLKYNEEEVRRSSSESVPDTLDVYLSHDKLGDKLSTPTTISEYTMYFFEAIPDYVHSFNVKNILSSYNETAAKDTLVFNIKGYKALNATNEEGEAYNYPVKVPTKYSYY